jgi:hypothetical protein
MYKSATTPGIMFGTDQLHQECAKNQAAERVSRKFVTPPTLEGKLEID